MFRIVSIQDRIQGIMTTNTRYLIKLYAIVAITKLVGSASVMVPDSTTLLAYNLPNDELATTVTPEIGFEITTMLKDKSTSSVSIQNVNSVEEHNNISTPSEVNRDGQSDEDRSLTSSADAQSENEGEVSTKYSEHATEKTETVMDNLQSTEVTLSGKNVSPIGHTPLYYDKLKQVTSALKTTPRHLISSPRKSFSLTREIPSENPHLTYAHQTLNENQKVPLDDEITTSVSNVTPPFGSPRPVKDGNENAGRNFFVSYFLPTIHKLTKAPEDINKPYNMNKRSGEHGTKVPGHSHISDEVFETGEPEPINRNHGVQSAESSKRPTVVTSLLRNEYTRPQVQVAKQSAEYHGSPNLLDLSQKLKDLETFISEKRVIMCEIHNMPLIFKYKGCKEEIANLPSFSDNMGDGGSSTKPKRAITAVLTAGIIVLKRYGELLKSVQRRLCSGFPSHHCPFTCVDDYHSFSHLENKVCLIHVTELRLNGVINILIKNVNATHRTRDSVLNTDDSIWSQSYPELSILTGLTSAIRDFINNLKTNNGPPTTQHN